jgi:hypothetical protein
VQPQKFDIDSNGTESSLMLRLGGDPYGAVILVSQFGPDATGSDPDSRIEKVEFKDGTIGTGF